MAAHSYCPVGACSFVASADTLKQAEALLRDHRAAEHGEGLHLLPSPTTYADFFSGASQRLPAIRPALPPRRGRSDHTPAQLDALLPPLGNIRALLPRAEMQHPFSHDEIAWTVPEEDLRTLREDGFRSVGIVLFLLGPELRAHLASQDAKASFLRSLQEALPCPDMVSREANKNNAKYATCPHCHRTVKVGAAGKIAAHKNILLGEKCSPPASTPASK